MPCAISHGMADEPFECVLAGILIADYVSKISREASPLLRFAEVMDIARMTPNVSEDERHTMAERKLLHDADVDMTKLENLLDSPMAGKCGLTPGQPRTDVIRQHMREIRYGISADDFNATANAATELRNALYNMTRGK